MLGKETVEGIVGLVNEAATIIVSSVDGKGYPNSKQMFKTKHDGLRSFWFSTNTSSMRVGQFQNDDPDYCTLQFIAETGNYYFNLKKYTFDIEEWNRDALCVVR